MRLQEQACVHVCGERVSGEGTRREREREDERARVCVWKERGSATDRQTDRQTDTDRGRDAERDRDAEEGRYKTCRLQSNLQHEGIVRRVPVVAPSRHDCLLVLVKPVPVPRACQGLPDAEDQQTSVPLSSVSVSSSPVSAATQSAGSFTNRIGSRAAHMPPGELCRGGLGPVLPAAKRPAAARLPCALKTSLQCDIDRRQNKACPSPSRTM